MARAAVACMVTVYSANAFNKREYQIHSFMRLTPLDSAECCARAGGVMVTYTDGL